MNCAIKFYGTESDGNDTYLDAIITLQHVDSDAQVVNAVDNFLDEQEGKVYDAFMNPPCLAAKFVAYMDTLFSGEDPLYGPDVRVMLEVPSWITMIYHIVSPCMINTRPEVSAYTATYYDDDMVEDELVIWPKKLVR